jgi:glutamine cyclotransferase
MCVKQKLWVQSLALAVLGCLSLSGCRAEHPYAVLETKDHDPTLFTQGLIVDGEDLIESSGLYGQSKIVRYNAETGDVINRSPLPSSIFAEGIQRLDDSIYLLTWREGRAYRLEASSFLIRQVFPLETEGWGLTHDGQHFIQSDGSDQLYFRNSSTFQVEKTITVRDNGQPQPMLNELEYANGLIWANVYMTPIIVAISPDRGEVVLELDLSELTARHSDGNPGHVLNGIAYDSERDAFWITGKCWSKRYLINIGQPDTNQRQSF